MTFSKAHLQSQASQRGYEKLDWKSRESSATPKLDFDTLNIIPLTSHVLEHFELMTLYVWKKLCSHLGDT